MLALAIISLLEGQGAVALSLLALAVVYGYRTYRFGCHYGRELYLQFLVLPDQATSPKS